MASTIHSSTKPDAFLTANHSSSFFLSPVDSVQVELALSGLDRRKASIDISKYLIKIASNLLSTPLTKISKVTPVFKTGAATDPGNYHPIAVLSLFAKILERLVYNQLNHFLENKNILFKHQFGFRKIILLSKQFLNAQWKLTAMKLYAVFFLTYAKPLILSTIRSYYKNYTAMGSMVSLSSFLKATLKAEHSMCKLKMLNQTHFLSNMVYHKVLFCFWYINEFFKKGKYYNICWWNHSILLFQFSTGPWKNYKRGIQPSS